MAAANKAVGFNFLTGCLKKTTKLIPGRTFKMGESIYWAGQRIQHVGALCLFVANSLPYISCTLPAIR